MAIKKVKALWDTAIKGKRDISSWPALVTPEGGPVAVPGGKLFTLWTHPDKDHQMQSFLPSTLKHPKSKRLLSFLLVLAIMAGGVTSLMAMVKPAESSSVTGCSSGTPDQRSEVGCD